MNPVSQYQFGIVGLAVMGRGLALNLAEHGFSVAGYNLEPEMTQAFVSEGLRQGYSVAGAPSCQALCQMLERPRKILIMVKAGAPVDSVLDSLLPWLEPGDVVIDGGNTHYPHTHARQDRCGAKGVHFLGMGVSGGEDGARHGPALMPGGSREAYRLVEPFLTAIAAHVDGQPCCAYNGPAGAGHFVKMVHNGIEYGDMQLICEAYYLMKRLLGLSAGEIAQYFQEWNKGELSSYLMEITAHILTVEDPGTGAPLVDKILGEAGSKGTGMWTVQEALSQGVPLPTIAQAVFARDLSCSSGVRARMSQQSSPAAAPAIADRAAFAEQIRRALYASKLCSYAQGFDLLSRAGKTYGWNLDLGGIALLFRGGCIIRASFLNQLARVYRAQPELENLLLDASFAQVLEDYQQDWRQVVASAVRNGVAVPAFAASLSYYDGLRDPEGPLNLLQAQRDCFGAHTFRRTDREGVFHHPWNG